MKKMRNFYTLGIRLYQAINFGNFEMPANISGLITGSSMRIPMLFNGLNVEFYHTGLMWQE
jgi:hypothetical protein